MPITHEVLTVKKPILFDDNAHTMTLTYKRGTSHNIDYISVNRDTNLHGSVDADNETAQIFLSATVYDALETELKNTTTTDIITFDWDGTSVTNWAVASAHVTLNDAIAAAVAAGHELIGEFHDVFPPVAEQFLEGLVQKLEQILVAHFAVEGASTREAAE